MATTEDFKPCPYGCTPGGVAFYNSYRRVRCTMCGTQGPDTATLLGDTAFRNVEIRKAACRQLWNARTPAAMSGLLARIRTDPSSVLGGPAAPAAKAAGSWQPCTQSHGTFVAGVEYRAQLLPSSSPTADLFASATDDEGDTHTVPARCFAGLLSAVAA